MWRSISFFLRTLAQQDSVGRLLHVGGWQGIDVNKIRRWQIAGRFAIFVGSLCQRKRVPWLSVIEICLIYSRPRALGSGCCLGRKSLPHESKGAPASPNDKQKERIRINYR